MDSSLGEVLVVDDDVAMRDFLAVGLGGLGYHVATAESGDAALARLANESFDAVVTDLRMRGMNGLDLSRRVAEQTSDVPVIVLTAFGDYAAAIGAVRAGAFDFFAKPVSLDALELAVRRAVEHRRLTHGTRSPDVPVDSTDFTELTGSSAPMLKLRELLRRISDSDSSVLLTGENGTGKEVVARALHAHSARGRGPFVAINCAALPEALLEGELFGHEKGAFTDAKASRSGLFVAANGGTLFLDEIGELPLPLQAKLLRALQERCVRPLGGRRELPFDVRLLSATNRDLEQAIEKGLFRRDLYYRINVIDVHLPPLRARGDDVLVLAQHFLVATAEKAKKRIESFAPQVGERFLRYPWPGNVRELQNVIERAVALSVHDQITVDDLPPKIGDDARARTPIKDPLDLVTLEEMEKRYILEVLEASGGSKSIAAKTLGVDRTTLWRKLERYQIEVSRKSAP